VKLENYLCKRAGLLAARGERVYTFPHRTFQEYLAACYLTDHGFPDQVAELLRADPQRWREATLLAGAKAVRGTAAGGWLLAEALCYREVPKQEDYPEADCWGALLAAQLLLENESTWRGQVLPRNAPKLERIRSWLQAIVERGWLPPVDRRAAGNALAALGDERDFDALVEIPAGPFWMGDDEDERARPRHQITLDAYRIGKYPVTVGQFRRFVEASGYEPRDADSLRGVTNHPVVYVTWHEARAYCRWLTEVWRAAGKIGADEVVRLPTEAEWEKAARGAVARGTDGRRYPWGDTWDDARCNTSESGLGGTTPVGMYPDGASPYGCLDMAGNVWEWTTSLWGEGWQEPEYVYPYQADDGRENLDAGDDVRRVVRGGSFLDNQRLARCAFRYWNLPYFSWYYYGFRVVVSPSRP
jgi:formylglycine-generating enzyme required for sulfatase activity